MVDQLRRRASLAKKKRKNGINGESPIMHLIPSKKKSSINLVPEVKLSEPNKNFKKKNSLFMKNFKRNKY